MNNLNDVSGKQRLENKARTRMSAKDFRDLIVWQRAHKFVLLVYKYSSEFPKEELYGLTSQLRRAAVSIAANIDEGFKKRTNKDKCRFMNIAQGSVEECRYYLILAADLDYGESDDIITCIIEVSKLLESYGKAILDSGS